VSTLAALTTDESAVIAAIVLLRLFVPLLIPRFPLPMIIAALILDAVDGSLLDAFTQVDVGPDGPYQSFDKALDIYYLSIAYLTTMRNWTSNAAFRTAQFLFYYRLAGVLLFELLDSRAMLLLFPNTFEFFFIFYEAVRLRFQPSRCPPPFWYAVAAGLWVFVKLPQEYWIHIAQRDFTETVANHPWFGVISALFVLALVAVLLFVVRPRLPSTDWGWRVAADPLPASLTDAHARHAHRLGKGGVLWAELAEKVALLSLISVIFAAILPHVTASSLQVGFGVAVIVCANTAISMWSARNERLSIESSAISFAALLAVNLGFVYLVSRVLSSADTVPLATALFFAFLITLLIWLYDVYKPVYDVRFTASGPQGPDRRPA
jgi:hypothetical protein